jgi:hypothetical protein
MFKDTCLVAHKRIDQSPSMYCLKIPRTTAAPEQNHLIAGHTINEYATNMYYECMKQKIR